MTTVVPVPNVIDSGARAIAGDEIGEVQRVDGVGEGGGNRRLGKAGQHEAEPAAVVRTVTGSTTAERRGTSQRKRSPSCCGKPSSGQLRVPSGRQQSAPADVGHS